MVEGWQGEEGQNDVPSIRYLEIWPQLKEIDNIVIEEKNCYDLEQNMAKLKGTTKSFRLTKRKNSTYSLHFGLNKMMQITLQQFLLSLESYMSKSKQK